MPFWRLFFHLVWATKGRQPWLTPEVEPLVHDLARAKASGLGGTVFALDGMPDHLHLVVSIPPRLAVASFVGQVKGVSSAKLNQGRGPARERCEWQEGYGAFSVDGKRLVYVIAYVDSQKGHHQAHTLIPVLECVDDAPPALVRETAPAYLADEAAWRREMLALDPGEPPDGAPAEPA